MELFELSGKTAVVTGSSRGIGRAIAERLAEHGARVAISSRSQADCDAVAAALNQLARNLAWEFGRDNVRVNCIAPGIVRTEFARPLWEGAEAEKRALDMTPMRRIGEPDDIAGAAVFLASPAGRWVTGHALVVDGGTTA